MSAFDAIVVGGGVQGVATVLSLSQRGLRCVLIEREPSLGLGVTGNSYGVIHGGLRYLQSGDISRWRRSKAAQAWFLKHFPHLVQPLQCVMPLYRGCFRSKALFRLAFMAEGALRLIFRSPLAVPAGEVWDSERTRSACPAAPTGLVGAAVWHDAALLDAAAVLRQMLDLCPTGLVEVRTGLEARKPIVRDERVAGLEVVESETGRSLTLDAPLVVLCAGPQAHHLGREIGGGGPTLSTGALAFNLVFDLPSPAPSVLAISAVPGKGRSYFVRPTAEGLLCGTDYVSRHLNPGLEVDPRHIDAFRRQLHQALPEWGFDRAPIRRVLSGLLPDIGGTGEDLSDRDIIVDHGAAGGVAGVYSILGVKLTTAPLVAEDLAFMVTGRRRPIGEKVMRESSPLGPLRA